MLRLDKVLSKKEVIDVWDGGTVVLCLNGEVVFGIQGNYEISVDKIGLIDAETSEFTDAICKYDVSNTQRLDNLLVIDINKKE